MYCTKKKVTDDLIWVGGNDRRLAMFEGVYPYRTAFPITPICCFDDTTVLFDTVDHAVSKVFFENLEHALAGRQLNYLIVQHGAGPLRDDGGGPAPLAGNGDRLQPAKTEAMIRQFFNMDVSGKAYIVKEGVLNTGRHNLTFVMAPMVHWPEVMVTYDTVDKILFSADAFGRSGRSTAPCLPTK